MLFMCNKLSLLTVSNFFFFFKESGLCLVWWAHLGRPVSSQTNGCTGSKPYQWKSEMLDPSFGLVKACLELNRARPHANLVTQSETALIESHVENFQPGDQSDVAIRERLGVAGGGGLVVVWVGSGFIKSKLPVHV